MIYVAAAPCAVCHNRCSWQAKQTTILCVCQHGVPHQRPKVHTCCKSQDTGMALFGVGRATLHAPRRAKLSNESPGSDVFAGSRRDGCVPCDCRRTGMLALGTGALPLRIIVAVAVAPLDRGVRHRTHSFCRAVFLPWQVAQSQSDRNGFVWLLPSLWLPPADTGDGLDSPERLPESLLTRPAKK